jgi:hypothetical protein
MAAAIRVRRSGGESGRVIMLQASTQCVAVWSLMPAPLFIEADNGGLIALVIRRGLAHEMAA